MRIVTWNVNSVRARVHLLPAWLQATQADVICLQELKCVDEQVPRALFEDAGYNLETFGQKTYNGVAIASRYPMSSVTRSLPLADDPQARGIAVITGGIRLVNLYVVNGEEVGSDKYAYKLRWLDALNAWVRQDAAPDDDVLLCGDFNIAPDDRDVHDAAAWKDKVLCSQPERARFDELRAFGLTDVWRHVHPDEVGRYSHTWWDYRGGGFQRGNGLRIDHFLASASLLGRVAACEIDRPTRKLEKTSDHAPVILDLKERA